MVANEKTRVGRVELNRGDADPSLVAGRKYDTNGLQFLTIEESAHVPNLGDSVDASCAEKQAFDRLP